MTRLVREGWQKFTKVAIPLEESQAKLSSLPALPSISMQGGVGLRGSLHLGPLHEDVESETVSPDLDPSHLGTGTPCLAPSHCGIIGK